MLGDIDPALVSVNDWNPVVYAGRDNATAARFVRYDAARRKDVPLDFSAVERMVLVLPALNVVFDSDDQPDVFDWGTGDGRVRFDLSDYAVPPGVYEAQLLVFDAEHPRGQVVHSGYQTDRDFNVSFQQVKGAGDLPPPHTEWVAEAPANGELFGRKNKGWFVLGSAAAADVEAFATAAQGEKADTAVQPADIADVVRDVDPRLTDPRTPTGGAGGVLSGSYPNPGFAVDMATQAELEAGLADKVDKVAGKQLSTEDFTTALKDKLTGLEGTHWRGTFVSESALTSGVPAPAAGDYADVDGGAGDDVARYIWDVSDNAWVRQGGESSPLTASQVKLLYESNPDTNAYTDAEQAKLDGIATGATANSTDVELRDRSTHTGTQLASTISDFSAAASAAAPVQSVNSQTGTIVLDAGDVGADAAGTAASAVVAHEALSDPHPQYLTQTEGDARYERGLTAGTNITIDRTDPENPVISASGSGGVDPESLPAAEALVAGGYVNLFNDGGTLKARKAGGSGKYPAHGFVKADFSAAATASVYPLAMANDALSGLTNGTTYFLSTSTPGAVQAAAPNSSGVLRQELGVAISATKITHANSLPVELV